MITTKIITNCIYFFGLAAAIILDINNFELYYGIVFVTIQIFFIISEYIITNRSIPGETLIVKKNAPFTLKDLLLTFPMIIILLAVINLLFSFVSMKYMAILIAIAVLSAFIQYLIIRGKNTPTLLIDNNRLFVNDFFLKTYSLDALKSITFNGLQETYKLAFDNIATLKIKQDDYRQDELNNFFISMMSKSNRKVFVSDNIKKEITTTA